jgi:hypothetical protein
MQDLKKTDPEAYYQARPWERPLTPEQEAERAAKAEKDAKREARNAKRRKGRSNYASVDFEAEDQKRHARQAGREASKDINLEPFLTGGKVTIKKEKAARLA